jgi:hypothetical protein
VSESLNDRLKRLPARRAPLALKHRVLAAVALRALPWYRRPFWTWSLPAQAVFAGAVALAAFGLLRAAGPAAAHAAELTGRWAAHFDWLAPVGRALPKVLWSARLALAALAVVAFAPAAALTGLAVAVHNQEK